MQALEATSFDRYARYSYTYRLRTELLPSKALRILDVGDPYGTLDGIFPDDETVSVDLFCDGASRGAAHQHVIGSGFHLPFSDGSFDLVAAHDVLEHVPDDGREAFVLELLRVSSGPVVVAAPFADARTSACEHVVNAYYVAHVGASLEPLDEHAEHGLPELEGVVAILRRLGIEHVVYSDGWLYHWLAFMLLKAHYVRIGAAALDRATDAAFNRLLRERDARPPHYRRALILRPPSDVIEVLGAPGGPSITSVGDEKADLEALAWDIVEALPGDDDPSRSGSALRLRLMELATAGGDRALVADSLATVLDEARRVLSEPRARPLVLTSRPSVTALVLDRADVDVENVVERLLAEDDVTAVVICAGGDRAPEVTGPARVVHAPGGDDALQLASAVESVTTDAILIVDPSVDFAQGVVGALVDSFGPEHPCVGFHRQPAAAGVIGLVPVAAGDALYVARELMLVDLELYRGLGGLDGRFKGQLDDVDFGWRMNLLGYGVATVGPAPWPRRTDHSVDVATALLWSWVKNLERTTLEEALSAALLLRLAVGSVAAPGFADGIDSLLRARDEVEQRRVVPDRSIIERFGLPSPPAPPVGGGEAGTMLRAAFPSRVGERPSAGVTTFLGDARSLDRVEALAGMLRREQEAIVVVDDGTGAAGVVALAGEHDLRKVIEHADVLVASAPIVARHLPLLADWDGVVVVDLEHLPPDDADPGIDAALRRADVHLAGSPRQQHYWEGRVATLRTPASTSTEVVMVVTPSVPAGAAPATATASPMLVLDLDGTDRPYELAREVVGRFAASASAHDEHRMVVLARAEQASVVDDWIDPGEGHVTIQRADNADERAQTIRRAGVVLRAVPDRRGARFGSASAGASALALGVPLVTTSVDPASDIVTSWSAGLVVAPEPGALLAAARDVLADAEAGRPWREAARGAAAALGSPSRIAPLAEVTRAPWRWRHAHLGGRAPLTADPRVVELLRLREMEVTQRVAANAAADLEQRLDAALAASAELVADLRARLRAMDVAVGQAQADMKRLRSHPAFRIAQRLRRAIRSGITS